MGTRENIKLRTKKILSDDEKRVVSWTARKEGNYRKESGTQRC